MQKDFWSLLVLVFLSIVILYLLTTMVFKKREGLENNDTTATTSTENVGDGIAGNAANYAAMIKAKSVQLQDALLISKYRTDYENTIINLEDYCNFLMLNKVLSMNMSGDPKASLETLAVLNTLSNAKRSLNECMQFVDKQP